MKEVTEHAVWLSVYFECVKRGVKFSDALNAADFSANEFAKMFPRDKKDQ
jgi:hypothetical protein